MDASNLRTRILTALAFAGVAAGPFSAGCSAEVDTSDGAGGGFGGSGGNTTSSIPSTGTYTPKCFDEGIGECCSSIRCFTLDELAEYRLGAGGAGGSSIGVGGDSASGGAGLGGSSPGSGVGGSFANFAAGGSGSGSGDPPEPPACPSPDELESGECYWFHALVDITQTECCYEYWSGSCCGRPFLVEGEARQASVVERGDWCAAATCDALDLPGYVSRWVADAWLADARLEHASIAAFARFTLQLLALGAPPDLIASSQQAATDELVHARACFALASRYAGVSLGPGPLAVERVLDADSIEEIAIAATLEGCVGETVAAMLAEEQLRVARDPEAIQALRRIAVDEAAHAELSWRFVAWAIQKGGNSVRTAVAHAMDRELQSVYVPSVSDLQLDAAVLHHHGRLTPSEQAAVRRRALEDVVRPCARTLLAAASDTTAVVQRANL